TPINFVRFGPPAGIDLQALTVRVDSITSSAGNLAIDTTFNMRNFGTVASPSFNYGVYLSEDTIYDPGIDAPLTPAPATPFSIPALGVTSRTHTGNVPLPDAGSWYVLAVIPPLDAGETNVFNNVVASSVPYASGVDLTAELITPPPIAGPGEPLNVDVRFSNQGFENAGGVSVKIYASVDTELTSDDRLLTNQTINVVGGQQVQQQLSLTVPLATPADSYYFIMQLDDGPDAGAIIERNELNNVVVAQTVTQVRQPDLVVSQVRVLRSTPPIEEVSSVFFGEQARFEAFVANIGGATASNVRLSFHMSDNETLNAVTDLLVGTVTGLSFAPGESRWVPLASATVPSLDNLGQPLPVQPFFFFGAVVGQGIIEQNNENNFAAAPPVVGRRPAPNFTPTDMQAPSRAGAGEIVAVSRTLANYGNRDGGEVKYRYYLSANTIITPDDLPVTRVTSTGDELDGTVTLAVDQRQSATELVRLPPTVAAGTYYLGVLLDPANEIVEADEFDNGLAAARTIVAEQSLGLANSVLPDAIVGLPYDVVLVGRGAQGPFSFAPAVSTGWPAGLTLTTDGRLRGTPTEQGAYQLLINVTSGSHTVLNAIPLRVARTTSSLMISAVPLPAPIRGVNYTARLGAVGGAGSYRFALVDGVLPVGVSMGDDGVFSGVPSDPLGTSRTFTIRCVDLIGTVDERASTTPVIDALPFSIVTGTLPDGAVGEQYLQIVAVANPAGAQVSTPVQWRVLDGQIPPGLAFEPSDQETIALSGTPTRPGRYVLTLQATDAQGRVDDRAYVISVVSRAVTASGDGTRAVKPGESVSIAFTATPMPEGGQWFWREGQLPPGVTVNADGTVTGTVPEDAPQGLYTFSMSVGPSAVESVAVVWWTIDVNVNANPPKTGCSAGGVELAALASLLVLSRRRRKSPLARS
ncbi:MAG: CARDB domain-containing protein, partial [Archangium sp.]